jgi:hypothetical protein
VDGAEACATRAAGASRVEASRTVAASSLIVKIEAPRCRSSVSVGFASY